MNWSLVIAVLVGSCIGIAIAWSHVAKKYRLQKHILMCVEKGFITPNEAEEWYRSGKPPSRLTSGALSPYD